jgi:hypothetical protein
MDLFCWLKNVFPFTLRLSQKVPQLKGSSARLELLVQGFQSLASAGFDLKAGSRC